MCSSDLGLQAIEQALSAPMQQALGRVAMGEAEWPQLELEVALILGQQRDAEMLPYLAAMLDSPWEDLSVRAGLEFCGILRAASQAGCTELAVVTQVQNLAAVRLYQSVGFLPFEMLHWYHIRVQEQSV